MDDEEQTYDSIDLKRHRPSFQKHSIINNQFGEQIDEIKSIEIFFSSIFLRTRMKKKTN